MLGIQSRNDVPGKVAAPARAVASSLAKLQMSLAYQHLCSHVPKLDSCEVLICFCSDLALSILRQI